MVKFRSGRYERAWVKNVVGVGSACRFVEPLEATSLGVICDECDSLVNSLAETDLDPGPAVIGHYNKRNAGKWDQIRQFLAVHYKFNTRFETPFWRECRAHCELGSAAPIVEWFQETGPGIFHRQTLLDPLSQFGLEGYWSLLIGQKVPIKRPYIPSPRERDIWRQIQQTFKNKALTAVDIKEALALIRSPGFRWPPTLYTQHLGNDPSF